jgi:hypothetical protein
VDLAFATAVSQLRDASGRQVSELERDGDVAPRASHEHAAAADVPKNLKTALILASVVLVFFAGVIFRHWMWP